MKYHLCLNLALYQKNIISYGELITKSQDPQMVIQKLESEGSGA